MKIKLIVATCLFLFIQLIGYVFNKQEEEEQRVKDRKEELGELAYKNESNFAFLFAVLTDAIYYLFIIYYFRDTKFIILIVTVIFFLVRFIKAYSNRSKRELTDLTKDSLDKILRFSLTAYLIIILLILIVS